MKKRRLITSALPYVNNIPHLGNLIQVLSADVFARYCRLAGYETLYVCGTDEYGTATETKAMEEGIEPHELCTRYYKIHTDIYNWFEIAFDKWGRTSTPEQTQIVQDIFLKLHANGYIRERTVQQFYSEASQMFLADRYIRGTCPKCGYEDARGDQCENCGSLLDPTDLINPRSTVDDSTPVIRDTTHLYIDLPAIRPKLEEWLKEASVKGKWARNAVQMTQAWIRDGLKERSITRDLKWGIPVPLQGFEDKVFYVWFDAPIGYISITATYTEKWEEWWKRPDEVELIQFIGKDNIPFHTVIFPSSLLGSGDNWTMLHHMSSSEYLNYEGGQFSKSRGIGVFGNDARDTGIPADVWRFYIFYNRPETSDYMFTWDDFQEKVNGELIGNLANLVNRSLTFIHRYFDGTVLPVNTSDDRFAEFWQEVKQRESAITDKLEWAGLRDGLRQTFALSSYGNRYFQAAEPWKTRDSDREGTHQLLSNLVYLVRDLSILIEPYIPRTAQRIREFLDAGELTWADLGNPTGLSKVGKPTILFEQISDELREQMRERFSGTQAERREREAARAGSGAGGGAKGDAGTTTDGVRQAGPQGGTESSAGGSTKGGGDGTKDGGAQPAAVEDTRTPEDKFAQMIELRAARIVDVEQHPEADKLFIEQLDDGTEDGRTIVSGLVGHYTKEDLLGKTIVVVSNLKPAKLRGVKSQGMLLAASDKGADQEVVDVLFLEGAEPGDRVVLQGQRENAGADDSLKRIKIDDFFSVPIRAVDGTVTVGSTPLECNGRTVKTSKVANGSVG